MNLASTTQLARVLADQGYEALFGQHKDQGLIDRIASRADTGSQLQQVICAAESHWLVRFLAAEFLFRYVDLRRIQSCDRALLADCYFRALTGNVTGNGVDWGFADGGAKPGPLAYAVIDLGDTAYAKFMPGLEDEQPLAMTFPWRQPPIEYLPYRIKDFAALIVNRISRIPTDLQGNIKHRDRAIAQLQSKLNQRMKALHR